jgi:hypothetical protein
VALGVPVALLTAGEATRVGVAPMTGEGMNVAVACEPALWQAEANSNTNPRHHNLRIPKTPPTPHSELTNATRETGLTVSTNAADAYSVAAAVQKLYR